MSPREQIQELEKIIEEQKIAISQISHEVRNPVTLINSSLKLIALQHPEVETFDFWQDTMKDMDYLLHLLNDVSSYNNSLVLRPQMVDMSAWLQEFAAAKIQHVKAPFVFSYEIPPHLPVMFADPIKLRQALDNLIRNAFEALESDGQVILLASCLDDTISLSVSDNGYGIPTEYMDTLFAPFSTHKKEGTGLGLTITHRIVKAHGGHLLVDTKPGSGTCFTIQLPVVSPLVSDKE